MMPTVVTEQAPVPPPSYHRREVQAQARRARALHINALFESSCCISSAVIVV